jgi:DNA-binding XRE family transcriptional regulator
MSEPINYQIIEQNGKPAFAVVPFDEFQKLINSRADATLPHEVVALSIEHDCSLVKAWRLYRKMSQSDMSEKMGISQSAYQQLENSDGRYQRRTLENLARALAVDVDQLTEA